MCVIVHWMRRPATIRDNLREHSAFLRYANTARICSLCTARGISVTECGRAEATRDSNPHEMLSPASSIISVCTNECIRFAFFLISRARSQRRGRRRSAQLRVWYKIKFAATSQHSRNQHSLLATRVRVRLQFPSSRNPTRIVICLPKCVSCCRWWLWPCSDR